MKRHQLKYIAKFLFAASFLSLICASTIAAEKEFTSTHKQARFIKPMHEGKPIALNTFCLDKDGNLLACVGGDNVEYVLNDDGSQEAKTIAAAKLLQVYSPEGELIRSVELPFTPTALNQAPDGSIFVAGDGKVARLGDDWKIMSTADSPHIGDMETFKQRVQQGAKKQVDEMTEMFRDQVASIEERIKKLKEKPEAELTERDKKRLATYEEKKGSLCRPTEINGRIVLPDVFGRADAYSENGHYRACGNQ